MCLPLLLWSYEFVTFLLQHSEKREVANQEQKGEQSILDVLLLLSPGADTPALVDQGTVVAPKNWWKQWEQGYYWRHLTMNFLKRECEMLSQRQICLAINNYFFYSPKQYIKTNIAKFSILSHTLSSSQPLLSDGHLGTCLWSSFLPLPAELHSPGTKDLSCSQQLPQWFSPFLARCFMQLSSSAVLRYSRLHFLLYGILIFSCNWCFLLNNLRGLEDWKVAFSFHHQFLIPC